MDFNKAKLFLKKTRYVFKSKRANYIGLLVGILFVLMYLWSIDNIIIGDSGYDEGFKTQINDNWQENLFRQRVTFLWEPVGFISVMNSITLFISPMNILLSLILGALVYINISVAVFAYQLPRVCKVNVGHKGIYAFLPSFLTGFACCGPTFLLALGPVFASSFFTIAFISIRPFLIPLSIVLMVWSWWWALSQVQDEYVFEFEKYNGLS